jgi:oxygen-independent coproporphyrinogen-3 oxidase
VPGVYLSYPFCAQKCTYCNFGSGVRPREASERYLEALRGEILAHAWEWTPETVYIGGGTPSMLDPAELCGLLEAIPGRPWLEATIEAAPGTITRVKAEAWAAAGINRVSLGVQSFVDLEIRRSGRKHTAAIVEDDLRVLAEAGISNCNVDLIAGLSGQTEAGWSASLDWIARLQPEHVSVYMLEVDEDSRLGKEMLLGGLRYGAGDTPSEDAVAAMYETAAARLAAMGIARYEISNFAKPGRESLHNLKYWTLQPYIGFGEDAHSFDGRARWESGETQRQPFQEDERFFVGLRLMRGIRPTAREWREYERPIARFVEQGLLETADGVLRLTDRGVMLSNEVFQEFLAA